MEESDKRVSKVCAFRKTGLTTLDDIFCFSVHQPAKNNILCFVAELEDCLPWMSESFLYYLLVFIL